LWISQILSVGLMLEWPVEQASGKKKKTGFRKMEARPLDGADDHFEKPLWSV